jgi:hypothetical protein
VSRDGGGAGRLHSNRRLDGTEHLSLTGFSIGQQIGYLSGTAPGPAAVGTWAAMVGGLILTRMTNDSELSDEILNETRAWLAAQNRKKTKTRRG